MENSLRFRVNVSQTSTGKLSWDTTVDGELPMADILVESDKLVAELKKRYPAEIPEPKGK